jgi:hypothetical protein
VVSAQRSGDDFARLHRLFVFHLGVAVALAWSTAAYAALHAPWVRNIRGLIDPFQRQAESTSSFLFGLPLLLTLAWVALVFGADLLRRFPTLRNQAVEFALAGAVAFAIFCMAIDRAVTAMLLAG